MREPAMRAELDDRLTRAAAIVLVAALIGCGGTDPDASVAERTANAAMNDSAVRSDPAPPAGGAEGEVDPRARAADALPVVDRVVFQRRADLYAINSDGTGLTPLATTGDDEWFAAATPGGRVIYTRVHAGERDLYSVPVLGGPPTALAATPASERFAGLTPLGRVIYRRCSTQCDLLAVNADGTGRSVLADSSDDELYHGSTRDGRVIYARATAGQIDLYSVFEDGRDRRALAFSADKEFFNALTPEGHVIYTRMFAGQPDLHSVRADGSESRRLATRLDAERFIALSSRGRVIFERAIGDGRRELHAIDADGSMPVRLLSDYASAYPVRTGPDGYVFSHQVFGSRIVVVAIRDDGTGFGGLSDAGTGNEYFGGVTPEGRAIIESTTLTSSDLYMVNRDGTGRILLDQADLPDRVRFSGITADSDVIYTATNRNQLDLRAASGDGIRTWVLASSLDDEQFRAATQSASRRIVFERRRSTGQRDLYSVDRFGRDLAALANSMNDESFAAVLTVSRWTLPPVGF
jgi:hypothetical protein